MKKLKIQFWKAEKALAMQILEQEGLPSCKEGGEALIWEQPALCKYSIDLRGSAKWANLRISHIEFCSNAERDEYLQKVINAITDELFIGRGRLKVGEMCEVRDDEDDDWGKKKLIAILPEKYSDRYIAEMESCPTGHFAWRYARPITKRTEPKVEECGQLITYTWEK
jgi:hypothetical protein